MAETKTSVRPSRRVRVAVSATGMAATAMLFVAAFSPTLPMYGDSLGSWGLWAAIHRSEARLSVTCLALAYLLYMVFSAYFATLVRGDDQRTQWLVRIATVAIGTKFAIEILQISILNLPTEIRSGPDFIPALAQLGTDLSTISLIPFFVYLLAVGAAAVISRAVPVWLAWFTLAAGTIHAFAMALGLIGPGPIGPVLVAFGIVWFLSILCWPAVAALGLILDAARGFKPANGATSVAAAGQAA